MLVIYCYIRMAGDINLQITFNFVSSSTCVYVFLSFCPAVFCPLHSFLIFSFHMSFCLFLSVYCSICDILSLCLFVSLSQFVFTFVSLSKMSACVSVFLSFWCSAVLSFYPSVCLSFHHFPLVKRALVALMHTAIIHKVQLYSQVLLREFIASMPHCNSWWHTDFYKIQMLLHPTNFCCKYVI